VPTDFRNKEAYTFCTMRTALLMPCSITVAFAQKTQPSAIQILEATAEKYEGLTRTHFKTLRKVIIKQAI
jgi:hypothetical protein